MNNYIIFKKNDFDSFDRIKRTFNDFLYQYYQKKKRILPWRETIIDYHVLISEFMLQQTQVKRVYPYFEHFIKEFPTLEVLALASQAKVLEAWSGLGYNRRAIYLHQAAKIFVENYEKKIPDTIEVLIKIKGIGKNTAGALITYIYNIPSIFVETNVRTVCFYIFKEYFNNEKISDAEIIELIKKIIDQNNPREWYYAIMDLGTELKKNIPKNHIQKSSSYQKQSIFKGSMRALRGKIIAFLTEIKEKAIEKKRLENLCEDKRFEECLEKLKKEEFIYEKEDHIFLKH
jgi:A/G-specific adenine glycosylase